MSPSAQGFFPHLKSAWGEMQSLCKALCDAESLCASSCVKATIYFCCSTLTYENSLIFFF